MVLQAGCGENGGEGGRRRGSEGTGDQSQGVAQGGRVYLGSRLLVFHHALACRCGAEVRGRQGKPFALLGTEPYSHLGGKRNGSQRLIRGRGIVR